MREHLQQRLEQLKKEFEAGRVQLEKKERQAAFLRETMRSIVEGIQVLYKLLSSGMSPAASSSEPAVQTSHRFGA
jgi:hypothetical protein